MNVKALGGSVLAMVLAGLILDYLKSDKERFKL